MRASRFNNTGKSSRNLRTRKGWRTSAFLCIADSGWTIAPGLKVPKSDIAFT